MWPKSIKWRLQVWHGVILVVVLTGFGFTAHRLQRAHEMRRVDEELVQRVNLLSRSLDRRDPPGRRSPPARPEAAERPGGSREFPPPPSNFRLRPEDETHFGGEAAETAYYVLWRRDGIELSRSSNAPSGTLLPARLPGPAARPAIRTLGTTREAYRFTPPGECLLAGQSILPEMARLRDFALRLTGLGAGVLAIGLAGGWWVATRAIRPIHDISAAAEKIAGGDLSHRVQAADSESELGGLASVLNSTFARLEAAFRRQEQFTADASHELRTPISVVLNQTQSALARERPASEYREALEACQRAAQQMRRLTESLLVLARLDADHEKIERNRLDVARLAGECLEHLRPLAASRRITFAAELSPAEVIGDAGSLAQVITNLLTNAIQYNQDGGEVRLATHAENGQALLTVSDTGPGIAAEHLPHIFERFYRADPARTASRGNAGLGLAISQALIEAHSGTIEVTSPPGGGATFTVRLPGNEGGVSRTLPNRG